MGKGNTCRKKSGFFPSINSEERQHVSEKNRKIELKKTFFEIFFPRQKKIPEFFFSGCGGCHFFLDLPVFPDVLDLPDFSGCWLGTARKLSVPLLSFNLNSTLTNV